VSGKKATLDIIVLLLLMWNLIGGFIKSKNRLSFKPIGNTELNF
jgi:hypothetical protein